MIHIPSDLVEALCKSFLDNGSDVFIREAQRYTASPELLITEFADVQNTCKPFPDLMAALKPIEEWIELHR